MYRDLSRADAIAAAETQAIARATESGADPARSMTSLSVGRLAKASARARSKSVIFRLKLVYRL